MKQLIDIKGYSKRDLFVLYNDLVKVYNHQTTVMTIQKAIYFAGLVLISAFALTFS